MFRGLSIDGYIRIYLLFFYYYLVVFKVKFIIDIKKFLLLFLIIYIVLYVFVTRTWILKMVNLFFVINGFWNVSIFLLKYIY